MNLGDDVKHRVSDFSGKVTAICEYLHAATRVQVTREGLSQDGKVVSAWFEKTDLEESDD